MPPPPRRGAGVDETQLYDQRDIQTVMRKRAYEEADEMETMIYDEVRIHFVYEVGRN